MSLNQMLDTPSKVTANGSSHTTADDLDPIEGLRHLEKLISEAEEFGDTKDKKISFNGNKMLNDLLDKPIGGHNDSDNDNNSNDTKPLDDELAEQEVLNNDVLKDEEEVEDEEHVSEEEDNNNDEAANETDDESVQTGHKRTIDDSDGDVEDNEDLNEDNQSSNKKKKKRIKKSTKGSSTSKKEKKGKKSLDPSLRKNIKSILKEEELDKETQLARKAEEERIQRQRERNQQRWQELQQQHQMQSQINSNLNHFSQRFAEIPDEVLLSSDDEDVRQSVAKNLFNDLNSSSAEVIDLSSGDEDEGMATNGRLDNYRNNGINIDYNMVGAYDEDDVAIIDNSNAVFAKENVLEDMNNCGTHTDDTLNTPDAEGLVLVNVAHPADEPDIYLPPQVARAVKPHQIGGIRFLYDNVIDSLERYKKSDGYGCILAHSMGLGKTMQVISFIDVFLTHTDGKHVLCIVPINTLQNWISEFNMWLPEDGTIDKFFKPKTDETRYRTFKVFYINESKSMTNRAKEILKWRNFGGVLLMGYEMYRILATDSKAKSKKDDDIDPKTLENLNMEIRRALVDPGPDLVVCDEGHRIKNCNAATSLTLKNIKTKRRIVLTGYPLQNKLMEYWCMIDFIRPKYLGQKSEFSNMFERPIVNGQCLDSTPYDRKLMKYRAHVLYDMLKGFVQRRSHVVLQKALPAKCEYVLMVRMSSLQKELMMAFLDTAINDPDAIGTVKGRISTLTLFAVCCKIWNHPDIVYDIVRKGITSDDLDLDIPANKKGNTNNAKKLGKNNSRKKSNNETLVNPKTAEDLVPTTNPYSDLMNMNNIFNTPLRQRSDGVIDYSWAEPKLIGYNAGVIENSYKMVLLFEIISECMSLGDRLLVFSQSLMTLDLIERFLQSQVVPKTRLKWSKNDTYYRLDGSTSTQDREKYINLFNETKDAHLFLISTRAGSLGINLIGANRIVIFDSSWNPCHDAQAACRIYRYGQPKPCYIYRLVCDNSLEKKIYDRQVNKQGMANRVVDEQNIEAAFTWREIHSLLDDLHHIQEPPIQVYTQQQLDQFDDELIRRLCAKLNHTITREPFKHESLLLDRKEQKLSLVEKRMAKSEYNAAKAGKVNGYDPSSPYAALRPPIAPRTFPNSFNMGGSFGGGMPYNMSHPSLPTQMTPQLYFNGLNQYPDASQPLPACPPHMRGQTSTQFANFESIAETLIKSGNSVKKIRMPNDLNITVSPTSTVSIKKGDEVMVIQTQKGLYLRTNDGNIISIKNSMFNTSGSQPLPSFLPLSNNNTFGQQIVSPTLGCGGTVLYSSPNRSRVTSTISHPPEVVQLSDDDDDDYVAEDFNQMTQTSCNIDNTLDMTQSFSTDMEPSITTTTTTNGSMSNEMNHFMPLEPNMIQSFDTSFSQLNEDNYNDLGLNSQIELPFDSILEFRDKTSSYESILDTSNASLITQTVPITQTPSSEPPNESAMNLDAFDLINT